MCTRRRKRKKEREKKGVIIVTINMSSSSAVPLKRKEGAGGIKGQKGGKEEDQFAPCCLCLEPINMSRSLLGDAMNGHRISRICGNTGCVMHSKCLAGTKTIEDRMCRVCVCVSCAEMGVDVTFSCGHKYHNHCRPDMIPGGGGGQYDIQNMGGSFECFWCSHKPQNSNDNSNNNIFTLMETKSYKEKRVVTTFTPVYLKSKKLEQIVSRPNLGALLYFSTATLKELSDFGLTLAEFASHLTHTQFMNRFFHPMTIKSFLKVNSRRHASGCKSDDLYKAWNCTLGVKELVHSRPGEWRGPPIKGLIQRGGPLRALSIQDVFILDMTFRQLVDRGLTVPYMISMGSKREWIEYYPIVEKEEEEEEEKEEESEEGKGKKMDPRALDNSFNFRLLPDWEQHYSELYKEEYLTKEEHDVFAKRAAEERKAKEDATLLGRFKNSLSLTALTIPVKQVPTPPPPKKKTEEFHDFFNA